MIKWLTSNKPETLDLEANYHTLKAAQQWTEEQQGLNYCGVVKRTVTTHAAFWDRVDRHPGIPSGGTK